MSRTGSAIIEDLKDSRVPPCLYWSVEQVSEWVASELGLEEYKVKKNVMFIACASLILL